MNLGFARCPAVVILESEGENMISHWIDAIVVSRTRRGRYAVYCRKWGECGPRLHQRWQTLNCDRDIATPAAFLKATSDAEFLLSVDIDWEAAVTELSKLDAVFAKRVRALRQADPAPDA